MSPEYYRRLLIDEFVNNFNEHHAKNFFPSELICVDESISLVLAGRLMDQPWAIRYATMDHKPENGCEVQNAACG